MGLKVITAPTAEPITLAEAKLHVRANDSTEEDVAIGAMITAAREECEHFLQRTVAPTVLGLYLDAFPDGPILLPKGPAISIGQVQYVDADGVATVLSQAYYSLDDAQLEPWILPAFGFEWPATRDEANALRVTYTAGFSTCPPSIKAWILLRIGTLYRMRESDSDKPAMPHAFADRLLDQWRVYGA
jgi:uncharacterized phiE125 gp8 family phage protein